LEQEQWASAARQVTALAAAAAAVRQALASWLQASAAVAREALSAWAREREQASRRLALLPEPS
jgi:hypothetical protein